jgi:hypothetical protein
MRSQSMSIVRRKVPASLVVLLISAVCAAALMSRVSVVLADGKRGLPPGGESPSVTTDKPDYGPTETATISGSGFGVGEAVSVLVTAPDGSTRSGDGTGSGGPDSVITDANGAFVLSYHLSGTLLGGVVVYSLATSGDGGRIASVTSRTLTGGNAGL